MANLNKVLLIGNLTRDPELRYTPAGAAICEFAIAVNRKFTGKNGEKEEVAFLDIVTWTRQAEICAEYLKKGRPVFVEGRLTQDRWEDKQTGQKRSRIRITAERVQFLGSPGGRGESAEAPPEAAEAPPEVPAEDPPGADVPF
ncbi:MAG: single-stranded DNA-binding protein [Planctomycetes bacterium]|nr:single-stranded DNA-binding protein [Planctomycetota bacterium]